LDLLGGAYFEDIDGFMAVIRLNLIWITQTAGCMYGIIISIAATVLMHLHSLNFRMILISI
jgi:hypothetical protein